MDVQQNNYSKICSIGEFTHPLCTNTVCPGCGAVGKKKTTSRGVLWYQVAQAPPTNALVCLDVSIKGKSQLWTDLMALVSCIQMFSNVGLKIFYLQNLKVKRKLNVASLFSIFIHLFPSPNASGLVGISSLTGPFPCDRPPPTAASDVPLI